LRCLSSSSFVVVVAVANFNWLRAGAPTPPWWKWSPVRSTCKGTANPRTNSIIQQEVFQGMSWVAGSLQRWHRCRHHRQSYRHHRHIIVTIVIKLQHRYYRYYRCKFVKVQLMLLRLCALRVSHSLESRSTIVISSFN